MADTSDSVHDSLPEGRAIFKQDWCIDHEFFFYSIKDELAELLIYKCILSVTNEEKNKCNKRFVLKWEKSNTVIRYIVPPTPLNFSTKAEIRWNTSRFLVRYCGLRGLILGRIEFSSVPFSLAYSRLIDVAI